jgi:uncharacterized protein YndB with AHSA1/START domain
MITKHKSIITVVPGKKEILVSREFDAPPEVVFSAYTDPDIFACWVGPKNLTTQIEKFEPKKGGFWRFIQKDPQGNEYGFHGVFHEVTPPDFSTGKNGRIIQTFEFEGLSETGHVSLDTTRFEFLPRDRTRVFSQSIFQTVEDRDGMVKADMETGIEEGFERLDDFLEKLYR